MAVQPIPDGYHSITPYLTVRGVRGLLEFVQKAFDAKVLFEMPRPDGEIGHAEIKIGDSIMMCGEARDQWVPMPGMFYLYVTDVDAVFQKAVAAGGEVVQPVTDQFYGDRSGGVKDACGNQWWIATHKEDVPPEEIQRRMAAAGKQ
ncbi:MAG TPA: VOC family protein [Gemmataceae bacterium]|jgi:PhnB protein|nr:VOC family protein [Gemmataceae bacterium]